jgi:hypothetical protein
MDSLRASDRGVGHGGGGGRGRKGESVKIDGA